MAGATPSAVARLLERHPGLSEARARQIARDREKLLRRGVPQLNPKWVAE